MNVCSSVISVNVYADLPSQHDWPLPSLSIRQVFVEHKGWLYRALANGWNPADEGFNTQQGLYLQLPHDFIVAPGDADCIHVAASHPWSTQWMFLGNSDAIATASQHQQAGRSKDSGYLLQRESGSGLELTVNCAAGILIRKKLEHQPASEARDQTCTQTFPPDHASNSLPFSVSCHLTCDDIEKFSRQILCPDVGVQGQAAIIRGRVLVVGLGGASSPYFSTRASECSLLCRTGLPGICLRGLRRRRHRRAGGRRCS